MRVGLLIVVVGAVILALTGCVSPVAVAVPNPSIRVPAEWETHAATWMQWPGQWESALRPAFARIIEVIQNYEPLHLLVPSASARTQAKQFLASSNVPDHNITWHIVPTDNAWMRDNGPIYITNGTATWIQDWRFDAWGGNFGRGVDHSNDDLVPIAVANYLGMTVEDHSEYILEKGNLEFNGAGTLVLNWDCQDDRNPGLTQVEHEATLKDAFNLSLIIWAYGHDPLDGTTGHIDGTARFVNVNTIVIRESVWGQQIERGLVTACEAAGLEVIRYSGDPNWLVGNGFVLAAGEGGSQDAEWQSQLESLFPDRDVHLIDVAAITDSGGGIHCVTNDQPQ